MSSIKFPTLANFAPVLVAAALLSLLVHLGLPPNGGDPLRSTLVVLPLVIAGLIGIRRSGQGRGGHLLPFFVASTEATLLILLVLIALGRHHLGFVTGDTNLAPLVAGGLALLLVHRIAWLVFILTSSLGSTVPARPPWPFFALPLIFYLSILPWSSFHHSPDGDEPHYLLLTHSLAYDFDSDLRNNYENADSLEFVERQLARQSGDPRGKNGQWYSRHNALLPVFLAPAYRLFGLPGVLVIMAMLTSAVCWLALSLSHWYEPDRPDEALMAYAILAFTAPLLLFSYQVWVEVPAALLILLALIEIHRLRNTGKVRSRDWLRLALPLLLLPLLKLRFLLISVPLAVLAIWRGGKSSRRLAFSILAGVAAVGLGILIFNRTVFQNPLKYHQLDSLVPQVGTLSSVLEGFVGLPFDCAFGLFSAAPLWMLLLPATILVIKKRSRLFTDFLFVFFLYLILLAQRVEWFGGWSPPFRYGIVMLPLLALWLIPLLSNRHRTTAGALLAVLVTLTLALNILWLVEPGWTYNLAHGRSHLLDLLSTDLDSDVARFFPSSVRPRSATYLWPPLALVAVSALWWLPKSKGRHAVAVGVTAVLLGLALLSRSAHLRGTRVVEFEDPWVHKTSGQMYPDPWVIYRPGYRGGWILPEGGTATVPLVRGGDRLSLRVDLRSLSPSAPEARLELRDALGEALAEQPVRGSGEWKTAHFEDLRWAVDGNLKLTLKGQGEGQRAVAILDRAYLKWGSDSKDRQE